MTRDNEGRTALMYAASNGTDDVVTLLLEAGADTSAVDKYGRTALSIAEAQGWRTIASALRRSESRQSNSVRSKPAVSNR